MDVNTTYIVTVSVPRHVSVLQGILKSQFKTSCTQLLCNMSSVDQLQGAVTLFAGISYTGPLFGLGSWDSIGLLCGCVLKL
jgi:hypothetical protein